MYKKIVSMFLCIIIIVSCLSGISVYAEEKLPAGFKMVTESTDLQLHINYDNAKIIVVDKKNGYQWKSFVDKTTYYEYESKTNIQKDQMQSQFTLYYTDMSLKDLVLREIEANPKTTTPNISEIENGCRVEFTFKKLGITVTMEYVIENNNLVIKIPESGIKEESNYGIINISFLPYFGAADRTVSGYLLYPDGSGAITRYENYDKRPKIVNPVILDIYSQDLFKKTQSTLQDVMLPVYGIKNNDNALLASITKGSGGSRIIIKPDGCLLNLNRINFDVVFRASYEVPLSNITISGVETAKKLYRVKAVKKLSRKDIEFKIKFMNGENANYSGMASAYRNQLMNDGLLNQVIEKNSTIPVSVEYFMGVIEKTMLFDKFISMTTFSEAEKITNLLMKKGVNNLSISLKGWNKNGYSNFLTSYKPELQLGGSSGLNNFVKYTKENQMSLFLLSNVLRGNKEFGGFSAKKDVAYYPSGLPVEFKKVDAYLLNPITILNYVKKLADQNKNAGIGIGGIATRVYEDYNSNKLQTADQTIETWKNAFEYASDNNPLAVQDGNLYALKYIDRIYGLSIGSSGYTITDEAVPFYQMVIHGSIPYSSKVANSSNDLRKCVLEWIEYGSMPSFELTYQPTSKLKNTTYTTLFTSYYEDWIKNISEINREFTDRLGTLASEKMLSHERLSENIVKVGYSNDEFIYINYSEENVEVDGFKIKAKDYIIIEQGGGIR